MRSHLIRSFIQISVITNVANIVIAQDSETNVNETVSPAPSTLVPTILPTLRPCYVNLTEVDDLTKKKDPFIPSTFILCPNTTYVIGIEGQNNTVVDGFPAITTRARTTYQCGDDGKSSNNCIISGGQFQLVQLVTTYNKEPKVNVVVKGLTFRNAKQGSLVLASPGDILFMDCVFENHYQSIVAPLLYNFESTRRLPEHVGNSNYSSNMGQLMQYYYHELEIVSMAANSKVQNTRVLQASDDVLKRQVVTFDSCIFRNNSIGPAGELTQNGIIQTYSKDNDLLVKNCTFESNNFSQPFDEESGFAIKIVEGATITVTDTCFINNHFVGDGVIIAERLEDIHSLANTYSTTDTDHLKCPFVNVGGACVPFTADTCRGREISTAPNTSPAPPGSPTTETSGVSLSKPITFSGSLGFIFFFVYSG